MDELESSLKRACERYISPYILPHGFSGPKMEGGGLYSNAYYIGKKTAVCIEAELKDQYIDAALYLLINGEIPENRVVDGKKVFGYIVTLLARWPGRMSYEDARKKHESDHPAGDLTEDWVEKGVRGEAYLFSNYADLILTDRVDIFDDHVKKGGFKF